MHEHHDVRAERLDWNVESRRLSKQRAVVRRRGMGTETLLNGTEVNDLNLPERVAASHVEAPSKCIQNTRRDASFTRHADYSSHLCLLKAADCTALSVIHQENDRSVTFLLTAQSRAATSYL